MGAPGRPEPAADPGGSPRPRRGHSQATDPLASEVGAFFARIKVPIDFVPGAEGMVAKATTRTLYCAFIQNVRERLGEARRCARQTAGWPSGVHASPSAWMPRPTNTGGRPRICAASWAPSRRSRASSRAAWPNTGQGRRFRSGRAERSADGVDRGLDLCVGWDVSLACRRPCRSRRPSACRSSRRRARSSAAMSA